MAVAGLAPERAYDPVGDDECLKERKWWCFLLSSIFTFIMGVVSVLLVRAIASIFCRKVSHKYQN